MQHSKLVVGQIYVTRGSRPLAYELVSTVRHDKVHGHWASGDWQAEKYVENGKGRYVMVRNVAGLNGHVQNGTAVTVDTKIWFVHVKELHQTMDDYVTIARHTMRMEQHRLATVERVSMMRNLLAQAISKKTGAAVDANTMFSNTAVLAIMLEAFRDTIE